MRILIVGAGIAGLTAALALARKGHAVQLLEQADALQDVGAGLQLGPNAMRVLSALGVADAVIAAGRAPQAITLRDGRTARIMLTIPLGDAAMRRWGERYVTLHRADLVAILADALEAVQPGALRTGCAAGRIDADGDQAHVTTATGEVLSADVLIGADGIHSSIRAQVFGADQARFTGHVAWRALIPVADGDIPSGVGAWLGPRRHAVTYRVRPGLVNFVGVTEQRDWREEGWNLPGDPARLRAQFAGWCPAITNLLARVEAPMRWALHDRKPMRAWQRGRALLIGDACHPMLPFLAQGAAMGIEDAFALAELLPMSADGAAIEQAAARFFALRQPRTARVQASARANGIDFHQGSPLTSLAARLPLGRVAASRPDAVMAGWDWLYGGGPLPGPRAHLA